MNCEVARFIILTFFLFSPPLLQWQTSLSRKRFYCSSHSRQSLANIFIFIKSTFTVEHPIFYLNHRTDRITSALIPLRWIFKSFLVDTMPPAEPERCAGLCRIWALVLALLLSAASVDGCPHKCSCSGSHVDCQGLGLKSVPKGVPRNAERL